MTSTPLIWIRVMEELFATSHPFACKLWRHYRDSPMLLWQLGLVSDPAESLDAWVLRIKRLLELISPASLLAASLAVAPETGRPRGHEVIRFEEAILQRIDVTGSWRW
jgi:hypothetical protein